MNPKPIIVIKTNIAAIKGPLLRQTKIITFQNPLYPPAKCAR